MFDDCLKYGCLLELKSALDGVFENTPIPTVVVSMLYANDFSKLRNEDSSSIAVNLIQNPPDVDEITKVIQQREDCAVLNVVSLFMTG